MIFANEFYFENEYGISTEKLKGDISSGKFTEDLYIIILSSNEEDLMEAFNIEILNNPMYLKYNDIDKFKVIGATYRKDKVTMLFTKIINDIYKKTGQFDVKNFFTFN